MISEQPITGVYGMFQDEALASQVAEVLNRWFRSLVEPDVEDRRGSFEDMGIDTDAYNWELTEDTDWQIVPHAHALGRQVSITLETRETHHKLMGLLRKLGAVSARFETD